MWLGEARFFGRDLAKYSPCQAVVTAADRRNQSVAHHSYGWHRRAGFLRFGKRQANVLEHERQYEPCRVSAPDDLFAIDPVRAPTEHCAGHDIDERLGIQSALSYHGDRFRDHLDRGCGHHVAEQFDQVGFLWVLANHERPLSEAIEDRLTTHK